MKVSVILPYANPHVLDWILMIDKFDLNIGCIQSTQKFRPGYFHEYDEINSIKYFFKSDDAQSLFEAELRESDFLITLGIYHKYLFQLKKFCKASIKIIVLSEPYNPINSKKRFLFRKLWAYYFRVLYKNVIFFCIGGEVVKEYYFNLGFKKERYFNFGYFPHLKPKSAVLKAEEDEVVVGYIGQLIPRKGFDRLKLLLLKLSKTNTRRKWKVIIAGAGEGSRELELLIANENMVNVEYLGLLNEKKSVERFLEDVDILFVPSYFDGWGAVVNEGVAKSCVIVSTPTVYSFNFIFGEIKDWNAEMLIDQVLNLINDIELLNREKVFTEGMQIKISSNEIAKKVEYSILNNFEVNLLENI